MSGTSKGQIAQSVDCERAGDPMMAADERRDLRANCGRCAGLCCVAPAFTASADFAIDKPAGRPCPNLRPDFGCSIHHGLREQGFGGCAAFDCFGAGQQVVQVTFEGADWRRVPEIATSMFRVFTVMAQLHEALWYLDEALALLPTGPLHDDVERVQARTRQLAGGRPHDVATLDASTYRREVGPVLERVSETLRAKAGDRKLDRTGANLIEAKLRGADFRGASLRGAYLIGADLRDADLRWADLLGADLRAADVRGALLDQSIFLTQPQLDAARGNESTTIPSALVRPAHWSVSAISSGRAKLQSPRRRSR